MRAFPRGLPAALLVLHVMAAGAGEARAACATPSGVAGQMTFTGGEMKYCDGEGWRSLKGSSVPGGCTAAGTFQYVPNSDFTWCDGSAQWSAKQESLGTACTSSGQWIWDGTGGYPKGCVGTTWYKLGAPSAPCTPGSQLLSFTGADQSFTVPAGCTSLQVKAWGGGGGGTINGGAGGGGGYATATLVVSGGETLTIRIGGGGAGSANGYTRGWPNGGNGGIWGDFTSGAGGGSSHVARGTSVLAEAGGGGGAMYDAFEGGGVNGRPGGETLSCSPGGNRSGASGYDGGGGGGYCGGSATGGGSSYPSAGAIQGSGATAGNSAACGGCGAGGAGASGNGGNGRIDLQWGA